MGTFNNLGLLRALRIFPIRTLYVTTDTENNTVTYGICPKIWKRLPCEGIILLNIVNTPLESAADSSLVSIDTTRFTTLVNNATTTTSSGARALLNGSGDLMVNEEITTGNRYLIFYNKNDGIFQTVNHIVV